MKVRKVDARDKEAAKKLNELEDTPMVEVAFKEGKGILKDKGLI